MKKLFQTLFVFCFLFCVVLSQNVRADYRYEELADEGTALKEILALSNVNPRDYENDYSNIDMKDLLMANACNTAFKKYLIGEGNSSQGNLEVVAINQLLDKYRSSCEKLIRVNVRKGIYTDFKPAQLADDIFKAMSQISILTPSEKNSLNKDYVSNRCFSKNLTIQDTFAACIIAVRFKKDVNSVVEKRLKGYDWETVMYSLRPSDMLLRSNYFNWTRVFSLQSGETLGYQGTFIRPQGVKRIQGKISVDDPDGLLSACMSAISTLKIPDGYREMTVEQENKDLAEKISYLISVDAGIVLQSLKKSDKVERAIRYALLTKKTKKSVDDIIKESKKHPTFGIFCSQGLKLTAAETKDINDQSDAALKTLNKK